MLTVSRVWNFRCNGLKWVKTHPWLDYSLPAKTRKFVLAIIDMKIIAGLNMVVLL